MNKIPGKTTGGAKAREKSQSSPKKYLNISKDLVLGEAFGKTPFLPRPKSSDNIL